MVREIDTVNSQVRDYMFENKLNGSPYPITEEELEKILEEMAEQSRIMKRNKTWTGEIMTIKEYRKPKFNPYPGPSLPGKYEELT